MIKVNEFSISTDYATKVYAILVEKMATDSSLRQGTEGLIVALSDAIVYRSEPGEVVECGSCGSYHPASRVDDCRDDRYRY